MRDPRARIITDLGFGDAGKGSVVDFLARQGSVAAVVRANGGGQAAHNVVTPDGRHHTFAQFGSGTFVPDVATHLSRFMLIDPPALFAEAKHLRDLGCGNPFLRLSIDEQALVVTPFHKAANRLREMLRGAGRHGSCGMGIGEATADYLADPGTAIFAADLRDLPTMLRKFRRLQEQKRETFRSSPEPLTANPLAQEALELFGRPEAAAEWADVFAHSGRLLRIVPGEYLRTLADQGDLLFEGAQGVLIDEWHGFHPYTTWSTATFANPLTLLREIGYGGMIERLGVLRAYFVRHGPGPFPTEDLDLTRALPDLYNPTNQWQGQLRAGWFDLVLARYALAVCGGADALAMTCLDAFARVFPRRVSTAYALPPGSLVSPRVATCRGEGREDRLRFDRLHPKTELTDLTHQEALTALLGQATPIYREAPPDIDAYLSLIGQDLGVPITITSSGPTARDKRFLTQEAPLAVT